jgi:hypothetical protein
MADTRLTLVDFAKSKDPDGAQAEVYELQNQYNPLFEDGPAYPANAPAGNRTTLRRSLPAVGTAKINKGVTRSKSVTDQRTDVIGYFAGRSEIDVRIRKIEGEANYFAKRRKEDRAFEEALAQLICNNGFYGNVATDEASFDGLAPRMNALNAGADRTAPQVFSQGAVVGGDGCSIFAIDWGEDATHWIYPPATISGLDVQDKPDQAVNDVDGSSFQADVTLYDQFVGIAVENQRHIGRVPNIDASDAALDTPTQGKLFDTLEKLFAYMPDPGPNQRVLYCPTAVWASFNKQARLGTNVQLTIREYLGRPMPHVYEWPLRRVDQLSVTEATVS